MMVPVLPLLLLVVLTNAQHELCRKEKDLMQYYIYGVSLQVKAYYCVINSDCKKVPKSIQTRNLPRQFISKCTTQVNIRNGSARNRQIKFCEFLGQIEVQENKLILSGNKTCPYSGGYCYDDNVPSDIFWSYEDVCDILFPVYKGSFTVWTLPQNKTKFIKNDYVSMKLTATISLCGKELWMADHKGIVVSAEEVKESASSKFISLNSSFPEECTSKPKVWYLYKYPKEVTGYFCTPNSNSCEDTGSEAVGNNTRLLDLCKDHFCDSVSCREQALGFSVCKKSLKVNFVNDNIQELPGCRYSSGHCQNYKVFWTATDRCRSISFSFMGYSTVKGIPKRVVFVKNSTKFTLELEGVLCNVSVWYTNKNGYLASEQKLIPLPEDITPTTEDLEVILFANEKEISDIRVLLCFAIFFVSLLVLWYIFGVIVNCFSLRRFNKGRTRKTRLLFSVCQSLTSRHLFLPQSEAEVQNVVQNPASVVTVDNDLYCSTN